MNKRGIELENLKEVAVFWRRYLDKLDASNEEDIAGSMTNVVSNDRWDDWYDESRGNPFFVEIYDLVTELEMPITNKDVRQAKWKRVADLLSQMEAEFSE